MRIWIRMLETTSVLQRFARKFQVLLPEAICHPHPGFILELACPPRNGLEIMNRHHPRVSRLNC